MGTQTNFKIVVLEDSEFYNRLLTRQLEMYTQAIAADRNCSFDIQAYTKVSDCLHNLPPDTDIAFIDYYLGTDVNAMHILEYIKKKCKACRIIIISQAKTLMTSMQTLKMGASAFVCKNQDAFQNSCQLIEDMVNERLNYGQTPGRG